MHRRWTPLLLLLACAPVFAADPPPDATTQPTGEIRRGVVMEGTPEERGRRSMERVVKRIEPSLHGDPARLDIYLSFFKREFVQDTRTFVFDASAERTADGTVVLNGYAEYPEHRDALIGFLKFLGFDKVENHIRTLPAGELGEKPFALVTAAHTTLYDRPDQPRENVSQALLGDPLFLLFESEGYYLCHSAEGYVGYVAAADVRRVTGTELSASQALPRATVEKTIKVGDLTIPAGAHLHVTKKWWKLSGLMPDGTKVTLPNGAVTVIDEKSALARVAPVITAAKTFMGTKYVWGGKSLDGIDCSGLVQTSYQTQGIRLPRDADQQGYVGQLVATRWHRDDLRPGDTLYFLAKNGRVHHTALFIGNHEFIEAANPGVKITSFDPAAKNYDEKRDKSFCFAKRILD